MGKQGKKGRKFSGRNTTAKKPLVLFPRIALRDISLRLPARDGECLARNDGVGGIGTAGPLLAIYGNVNVYLSLFYGECRKKRGEGWRVFGRKKGDRFKIPVLAVAQNS